MNENINGEVENNNETTSNTNQLFDLIQSIQSKLNNENIENNNSNNTDDNKVIVDNKNTSTEENIKGTVDFSSLLKNIDLNNILNIFNTINSNNIENNSSNTLNLGGLDSNLLMKFGNMFSSANRSDPKKNLLLSLKPFLRKTRQDKLNEYITILTIVDTIGIFNSKGSDNNV